MRNRNDRKSKGEKSKKKEKWEMAEGSARARLGSMEVPPDSLRYQFGGSLSSVGISFSIRDKESIFRFGRFWGTIFPNRDC